MGRCARRSLRRGHARCVYPPRTSQSLYTLPPLCSRSGTALADAVREGHGVVATKLIEQGATLGFDEVRTSAELCERASKGDVARIKLLLKGKCNPSAKDYDQRTCLHLAASEGNMHVIRELLSSKRVEINHLDRWGSSALSDAVSHGHRQCAMELRKAGALLKYDDNRASGELCQHAREGNLESIKLLVDCGIQVAAADYDGRTVIHLAASNGHKHIVDFLAMRRCVDLTLRDRWGGSALDDAVREKHTLLAESLAAYYRANGHSKDIPDTLLALAPVEEAASKSGGGLFASWSLSA